MITPNSVLLVLRSEAIGDAWVGSVFARWFKESSAGSLIPVTPLTAFGMKHRAALESYYCQTAEPLTSGCQIDPCNPFDPNRLCDSTHFDIPHRRHS
jgi:hypothetical protein